MICTMTSSSLAPWPLPGRARTNDPAIRGARLARPMFWDYEFAVMVSAPDTAIDELEMFANRLAPAGWDMELWEGGMHFRFVDRTQAAAFLVLAAKRYQTEPLKRVPCPATARSSSSI
jgi:hypothetical protein